MQIRRAFLMSLICVTLIGCGREELPFTDNSQDTELYAKSVRELVESHCKGARKGDPTLHIGHLYQELERTDRPVGDREEIFNELRLLCRQAVELIRANENQRPDLTSQLDGMVKLASELPKGDGPAVPPPEERGS